MQRSCPRSSTPSASQCGRLRASPNVVVVAERSPSTQEGRPEGRPSRPSCVPELVTAGLARVHGVRRLTAAGVGEHGLDVQRARRAPGLHVAALLTVVVKSFRGSGWVSMFGTSSFLP